MSTEGGAAAPIRALTSLRFLPAIWVVLHHYGESFVQGGHGERLLEGGYTGVALFFVLSGFILAVNYPPERLRWKPFLKARLARIYPVYVMGTLVALPLFFDGNRYVPLALEENIRATTLQVILNALLVQAWLPDHAAVLNRAGWSLSVEALFYVSFVPIVAWKATRALLDRSWLALILLWLLGISFVAIWQAAHPGLLAVPGLTGEDAWNVNFASFHPLMRLPEFLMGIALGRWHLRGGRIPGPGWWILFSTGVVAASLFLAGPFDMRYLHNTFLALPFAIIILGFAQLRGRAAEWMGHPVPHLLGEASYALYILHMPVHDWMKFGSYKLGIDVSNPIWTLTYLLVAIAVSVLVFRFFETPARRWIRAWGEPRSRKSAT